MNEIERIVSNFLHARLPLEVSSYQIRCVSEEIAQAIEARSAETGNTDSARQGESAVAKPCAQ